MPSLRSSVSVIDNQADRPVMLSLGATSDLTQQLEVHRIQQFAPLDITIIHKTILIREIVKSKALIIGL